VCHSSDNVAIEGLELAFRMKFSQSSMEGSDARIGRGKGYLIQLMILDFDTAKLVMFKPSLAGDIKHALEFYLRKYLVQLNDAGQNCLLVSRAGLPLMASCLTARAEPPGL
jgi:hypothetical protein